MYMTPNMFQLRTCNTHIFSRKNGLQHVLHTIQWPNHIFVLITDHQYQLLEKLLLNETKPAVIQKDEPFMIIDYQPVALPFKFRVIEINNQADEHDSNEYVLVGLIIKKRFKCKN